MHRITAWQAQRSSTTMTLVGKDPADQVVKIAQIVSIEAGAGFALATDVNGLQYQLVCDGSEALLGTAPADVANGIAA